MTSITTVKMIMMKTKTKLTNIFKNKKTMLIRHKSENLCPQIVPVLSKYQCAKYW